MGEWAGVFGTIFGVVLGWGLNEYTSYRNSKPKLFGVLEFHGDEHLIPREKRIKTSETEYNLKIYNVGREPFVINTISVYNGNDIIVGGLEINSSSNNILLPYEFCQCDVMQQDLDNLEWHLSTLKKSTLELHVTSVDGKEVTCSLDLQIIKMNVDLRDRLYGSK